MEVKTKDTKSSQSASADARFARELAESMREEAERKAKIRRRPG